MIRLPAIVARHRRTATPSSISKCLTRRASSTLPNLEPAPAPKPGTLSRPAAHSERVIFSGIQPTGTPHLGNFAGAIQQWVRLQDEHTRPSLLFSIVDLHAITVPQPPGVLARQKQEVLAALLACGLQPDRCSIFYQSSVPEHTELMWILSCTASVGYLSRMTQWKSKLSVSSTASVMDEAVKASLKLGLFSYPVLQAADILLYRATHVPVGEDQRQHLEFARKCATNFNHTYGPVLVSPETITPPARRIKSLKNPLQKMSKSDPNPASRLLITDSAQDIQNKIMAAVTDSISSVSYDPEQRPGVSNLLEILSIFDPDRRSPEILASYMAGASLKDLKVAVASSVISGLAEISERYFYLMANKNAYLQSVQEDGASLARARASETMAAVRSAIGF